MVAERVNENEQAQENKKKGKKKRDGPSLIYEDDNNLHLEFSLVQKFSKVQVSPPIDSDELPKIEKTLQVLRDAL